ncbi:MAG: SUMF1/EgtB/PvdO family nonheme iron enzyme [Pyrinomonadaceae bacterium]
MKECPACRRCFPDDVNHCPQDGDVTTASIAGEPVLDGRYQLERRIGHGGMGVVFQARHIFLKTAHAIKVILPDLVGNDPMLVTRFRQEALAAAAIRHPNIIAVTDFGVVNGKMPFLVMEYVKGKSLHEILAQEGALSPARALEILAPVCSGMVAAHRQKIVHRDLKPLNIMLQEEMPVNEAIKILDFGLAKIKSGELLGSFVQAQTSGLMGSPFYMAPEQWSDEEPDARADIYSLGIILYQMLGGDVPFKGTSVPSIMKKHLTLEPPPLSTLGVDVPPQVELVVRHALEKDPANRPQSVEDFVNELRGAVASTPDVLRSTMPGKTAATPASETMMAPGRATGTFHTQDTILRLHTNPPQSRVFVNNVAVGVSNQLGELAVHDMKPGQHHVRIVHEGYAEWERQVECNGAECRLEAELHALAPSEGFQGTDPFAGTITGNVDLDYQEQLSASIAEQRKQREERERLAREEEARRKAAGEEVAPVVAVDGVAQAPSNFASTQMHRPPQVTQPIGDHSLPGVGQQTGPVHVLSGQVAPPVVAPTKLPMQLILAAAAFLVVAIGGGGGYYYYRSHKATPPPPPNVNAGPTVPGKELGGTKAGSKAILLLIPGGTFKMGRNNSHPAEFPEHDVTVASFYMDMTEVTNSEYADFVSATNYTPPSHWVKGKPLTGQEIWPVVNVSLDDAMAFAAWRSKRDSVTYRLPTEEEWEYAARSGDLNYFYPWGNKWDENRAVVQEPSPRDVGSYPDGKDRWGVVDLIGNVWEWTSSKVSLYPGNPAKIPATDRDGIIYRGGSYASDPKNKQTPISATFRTWLPPTTKGGVIGFRLVRDAK